MKKILFLVMAMMVSAQSWGQGVVKTNYGKLQGVASEAAGITVFRGVPYAQPPVGDLRWRPAQPLKPWKGTKVADKFGNISWQNGSPKGSFYWKEFYQQANETMSEDCLYLNIWAPTASLADKGTKLPVAFWVHGGAYQNGYGHEITMDGDAWAKRGVILVTINYRLGLLGFLSHHALSAENSDHVSGNYGLTDQIMALQWVHDNIVAFGGDSDNITVIGQSAGAASVKNLVASPRSRQLIRHCIIQSGGGLGKFIDDDQDQAKADAKGKELMDDNGLTTLASLRSATPQQLLTINGWGVTQPHVDGINLTENFDKATMSGSLADVDYMIGQTMDDIMGMNKGLDRFCYVRDSISPNHRVYQYYFARKLPGSRDGAFHSSELWYMFHTLTRSWRSMTKADYDLADRMMDYWTNFCKYGNPNGTGTETWHPFTAKNPYVETLNIK